MSAVGPETGQTLAMMTVIDETSMERPRYGNRQMARNLRHAWHEVGRRRARPLKVKTGLTPIHQRPRTSDPYPRHRVSPQPLDPDATLSRIGMSRRFEVRS